MTIEVVGNKQYGDLPNSNVSGLQVAVVLQTLFEAGSHYSAIDPLMAQLVDFRAYQPKPRLGTLSLGI